MLILLAVAVVFISSCNEPQPQPPAEDHTHAFSQEWTVSTPATIFAEGKRYRICTADNCDHKEYETIPKIEITKISIAKQPSKLEYVAGDKFDPLGMSVVAVGTDGSEVDVTLDVTFSESPLTVDDKVVTVTYREMSSDVSINVIKAYSVSEALAEEQTGKTILVQGLFAGVADEGAGFYKELLLKDVLSDKLIAVQGVTYGTYPRYGYEKGDLVRIYGTVVRERYDSSNTKSENKTYIQFADTNPQSVDDTIVSRGNTLTYTLENVIEITSWNDMKKVFNAETLEAYTYIHVKGDVWFNTYAKASDGVLLHRFCMTSSGTSLSKIKPDGVRAVGLRQNMLEANVPTAMTTFFDEIVGTTSFPGNKANLDFYAVVTAANNVNFQLTILESDWMKDADDNKIEIKTKQDIVKEMGFVYYRQGTQILYDQRYRNENPAPEAATSQNQLYLDCSSFVNAVYYEAFGINILGVSLEEKSCQTGNYANYAKENKGKKADVIGYWETADYKTAAEQTALLNEVYAMLQVGDILNYRHGKSGPTSGHALLYIGDGMFLHSTGGQATYSSEKPETNEDIANVMELTHGTVQKISASALFTSKSSSRYLFRKDSKDTMYNFCIIRPLNNDLTATEKTQARMKIPGLSIEKTVYPGIKATVVPGNVITYSLRIENHSSNVYTDILFEDILSDLLIFVGGTDGITVDGQKLTMKVSIGAMETVEIKWKARVKADAKAGAAIESCNTSFGGVEIFDTLNYVSAYTDEQLSAVAEKAVEYTQGTENKIDPLVFAKMIYKESLGVDILDVENNEALMNDLFKLRGENQLDFNEKSRFAEITVPQLHSGTAVHRLCDIVQIHRDSDFALGDLIFCRWKNNYRLFVYVGDSKLVMVDTVTGIPTLVENGKEYFQFISDTYCMNSLLGQLRTYEICAVLRPAMGESK